MAEKDSKPSKKRQLKRTETVRERAAKTQVPRKERRLTRTATTAAKPLRRFGRLLGRIFSPFRFLLWPFKTRIGRFLGRILTAVLFLRYIRNSWRELRQVTWPDRRQTTQLTIAVFIFALFFALVVSLVDYGLDKAIKPLIIK